MVRHFKICIILVLLLSLATPALAGWPYGEQPLNTLGVSVFLIENLAAAWFVDRMLVEQGNESNFWGAFLGSCFSSAIYTAQTVNSIDRAPSEGNFVATFISFQIPACILGQKFLEL